SLSLSRFPYTTLFRSDDLPALTGHELSGLLHPIAVPHGWEGHRRKLLSAAVQRYCRSVSSFSPLGVTPAFITTNSRDVTLYSTRSEEHTSELQSRFDL